jgi:hypothetical protein
MDLFAAIMLKFFTFTELEDPVKNGCAITIRAGLALLRGELEAKGEGDKSSSKEASHRLGPKLLDTGLARAALGPFYPNSAQDESSVRATALLL